MNERGGVRPLERSTEGAGGSFRALAQERVESLRGSRAFENYQVVREHVLRMLDDVPRGDAETAQPSAYWAEELLGFEYMLDAGPLIVEKLRHHTYHLTGLKVYDYRTNKDRAREQLIEKRRALLEVGDEALLVPESPILGGFGFEIDGELYNVDTLKYFEAMIALDRGAVLDEFRASSERQVVWEIGAGWGGLPRVFRTLFPNVTYVITDLPQAFLFSATYLMTAFPDAKCVFHDEAELFDESEPADFVFVPHYVLDAVAPPRLDLTVNMVSFQEMTTAQVEEYVRHAHAQGSQYLYSLNRDSSLYNREISNVHDLIELYYLPRPVEVLPVSYVKTRISADGDKEKPKGKAKGKPKSVRKASDYRHVIGWRKMTV